MNLQSKQIIIEGSKITDKASLYEEFNQKLMPNEDWKMGESLDAFNDVLYGGFGEIVGNEAVQIIWKNFDENKNLFGYEFTLNFYLEKLKFPEKFNVAFFEKSIDDLRKGIGKTYFQIILEIIADHPNIELIKA